MKVSKKGLAATEIAPGDRTSTERRRARKADALIKALQKEERAFKVAEHKLLKERMSAHSKKSRSLAGIARAAMKIKYFWAIPNTKPRRYYPETKAIDLTDYDLILIFTQELAEMCLRPEYINQYGSEAASILVFLESPGRTKPINIAATCRVFADLILDNERESK